MHKSNKRTIVALLCAAMALLVISPVAAQKYKGVTITAVMQDHNATKRLKEFLPEFEAATGMKVMFDVLPQAELFKKVETGFVAGSDDYDVTMTLIVNVSRYARAKWIEPLDKYIAANKDMNADDFMPGFINSQQYQGKTYGLPFYGESSILMYRKDLLDAAKVKVPQTMDELLAAAKVLTKDNVYGIVLKGNRDQASNGYLWPMFLHSWGGEYFDKNHKPIFNGPEGQKATAFFAELMKYAPPGSVNMGWNEVQVAVSQGQAAMTIDATNFATVFETGSTSKVTGKIGYAPVPKGLKGRYPAIAVASLNINATSKQKDASFAFINWATSAELQKKMASSGIRPDVTRDSVFEDPTYQKVYDWDNGNWYKSTQQMMKEMRGDYRPVYYPEWVQIGNAIAIKVQSVFTGEKTSAQAMDEAANDVSKIMKDAGYY
ncbi:MAG: sugar ABC transporter substrate-binding protein [Spirochaetes bacterium]|nr:sugar ABC transporter substrate-binding protein [Spirochaetota bacterium]